MRALPKIALYAAFLGCSAAATGDEIKVYLTSGTGFFVSPDGYVLTNKHVVENCTRITIDGAVSTRDARLVTTDAEHDLALLHTDASGFESGNFRDMSRPVQPGERVVLVGYPGDAYKNGIPVTREASVVSPTGPQGESKWLQLSDVIEKGNSGGPLYDSTGNIIGVVVAKAVIYTYPEDDPQHGTTTNAGLAISLSAVQPFLADAGVRYRTSYAEGLLSSDSITDHARHEIVNVRCEYKREIIR